MNSACAKFSKNDSHKTLIRTQMGCDSNTAEERLRELYKAEGKKVISRSEENLGNEAASGTTLMLLSLASMTLDPKVAVAGIVVFGVLTAHNLRKLGELSRSDEKGKFDLLSREITKAAESKMLSLRRAQCPLSCVARANTP